MYVCVCRAVTEQNIRDAVQAGAHSMKALREQLGVGEDCGCCGSCAKQCLRDANAAFAAGFDQAPAAARFPTHDWRTGDRILGGFSVPLPATLAPGDYEIWVGLYETASQGALRLPITAQGERTTGDGEVLVGTINIR